MSVVYLLLAGFCLSVLAILGIFSKAISLWGKKDATWLVWFVVSITLGMLLVMGVVALLRRYPSGRLWEVQ